MRNPSRALPHSPLHAALAHEAELLGALPSGALYERSYMHRDVVTHVLVTPRTDFIVTGSADGVLKFWKKLPGPGLEFVKAYRCAEGVVAAGVAAAAPAS